MHIKNSICQIPEIEWDLYAACPLGESEEDEDHRGDNPRGLTEEPAEKDDANRTGQANQLLRSIE